MPLGTCDETVREPCPRGAGMGREKVRMVGCATFEGAGEKTFTYRQIRALISPLPVANNPPVGLGATEITTQRGYGQLRLT
jgi:hypothetical protein